YLSKGFSWKSDYVLSLDQAGTLGDVKGWVTMTNNSGTSFENAKLKLLAGEVNRVRETPMPTTLAAPADAAAMPRSRAMAEEQFGDYHLYTLDRLATVRNNEIKQLSLLEAVGIKVNKVLLIDSARDSWSTAENDEVGDTNIKPTIYIELENSKENNMGMPLPAGTFKVFQRSKSGSLEMLGEDSITHTPRNEKVKLHVGQAFDVVASRKRTAYVKVTARRVRETFEIEVRNRKESPETVTVWERNSGDHKVTKANMEYTTLDSTTTQFLLKLGANEVKTIVYTVETKW
ncbi:MAG: hypothetical protein ABUL72_02355, partial [Armatimonadota bacterium]